MLIYPIPIIVFIYFAGMCIGSFLNVCIYRIPESKSVVYPPSSCPNCGYQIRWYDNIPLLSYLWLKAKCRQCKIPISFRYPMIEVMTGLFALSVLFRFGLGIESLIYFAFTATMIVITFIDLDHQIIPDIISLPGIPIFFLASFWIPTMTWKDSLIGIVSGGGSLWLVAEIYMLIAKKEGMGGGDIKLLAMMGALIGWKGVLFTIFFSSAIGTFAGLAIMLHTRKNLKLAIPFGPFLAIGAMMYIFWGEKIIRWYLHLLR